MTACERPECETTGVEAMTEEIYITIGSRSGKFAKRNVGKTTRWPIKNGAPKGARVYFLIGSEFVAKGVIATEDVRHAPFKKAPRLWRDIHQIALLNAPVSREMLREQIPDWGWLRSKHTIQTSVPAQFVQQFLQIIHNPPVPSDAHVAAPKVRVEYEKRIRDSGMIKNVKAKCGYRCHVKGCDFHLPLSIGVDYVEGHHVKPLAHDGTDTASNVLILCPNHHALFDYRIPVFETRTRIRIGDRVEYLRPHDLSQKSIDFHNWLATGSST